MKVMLVIPKRYYGVLLRHCAVLWPEYRALQSGIVVNDESGKHVQILCDPPRLKLLMNLARRVCAEAIPHMRQVVDWSV